MCSQPSCKIPERAQGLHVWALALLVLSMSMPKPLVTVCCQMAMPSEPVVSTSALNITTLIPFPRWQQRDNASGTLENVTYMFHFRKILAFASSQDGQKAPKQPYPALTQYTHCLGVVKASLEDLSESPV